MDQQFAFREGMTVYGADGDKVGKVVAVDPSYIVVEKGFFFPTDYYIPTSAINTIDDDNVYLTVSKDEALNQGWDQPLTATPMVDDERFRATTTDAELTAAGGAGYGGEGRPFGQQTTGRVEVEKESVERAEFYGNQTDEAGREVPH